MLIHKCETCMHVKIEHGKEMRPRFAYDYNPVEVETLRFWCNKKARYILLMKRECDDYIIAVNKTVKINGKYVKQTLLFDV